MCFPNYPLQKPRMSSYHDGSSHGNPIKSSNSSNKYFSSTRHSWKGNQDGELAPFQATHPHMSTAASSSINSNNNNSSRKRTIIPSISRAGSSASQPQQHFASSKSDFKHRQKHVEKAFRVESFPVYNSLIPYDLGTQVGEGTYG